MIFLQTLQMKYIIVTTCKNYHLPTRYWRVPKNKEKSPFAINNFVCINVHTNGISYTCNVCSIYLLRDFEYVHLLKNNTRYRFGSTSVHFLFPCYEHWIISVTSNVVSFWLTYIFFFARITLFFRCKKKCNLIYYSNT